MGKNHKKLLAAPKAWALPRKRTKYILRSAPGGHALGDSMPLGVILRDMLGLAKTAREARFVLNEREVLVDGKRRKVLDFPIGPMDVVVLPQIKRYYRMLIMPNGNLGMAEIPEKEQHTKLCRIVGKKMHDAKVQLTLSDGRTVIAGGKEGYKVGDSVQLQLPEQKIVAHFPFAEGATAYLVGGSHRGSIGSIVRIDGNTVQVKGDGEFQTPKQNIFVVGKEKPAITLTG